MSSYSPGSWEWFALDAWIPYDERSNKKIVKAGQKNKTHVEIEAANGIHYVVDLTQLVQWQKNLPGKQRKIRWNDGTLPRTKQKVGT